MKPTPRVHYPDDRGQPLCGVYLDSKTRLTGRRTTHVDELVTCRRCRPGAGDPDQPGHVERRLRLIPGGQA